MKQKSKLSCHGLSTIRLSPSLQQLSHVWLHLVLDMGGLNLNFNISLVALKCTRSLDVLQRASVCLSFCAKLSGSSALSWCRVKKKNTWKLTNQVAHLWYLKEKWFPARIIYIHSAFTYTQAHTNMQVRSWWHRAVSVVLFLLSFLCTEQNSICTGYFYIRKLSDCSTTDKAQANLAVMKWQV